MSPPDWKEYNKQRAEVRKRFLEAFRYGDNYEADYDLLEVLSKTGVINPHWAEQGYFDQWRNYFAQEDGDAYGDCMEEFVYRMLGRDAKGNKVCAGINYWKTEPSSMPELPFPPDLVKVKDGKRTPEYFEHMRKIGDILYERSQQEYEKYKKRKEERLAQKDSEDSLGMKDGVNVSKD
jgi:hypothetical protein